jgi:hypothetical protein
MSSNPYDKDYAPKKGFPFTAVIVIFIILALGLAGLAVYFYVETGPIKAEVDRNTASAVADARKTQLATDQKSLDKEIAKTTNTFTAPADFGSLAFEYPETWSAYVDCDGTAQGNNCKNTTYTAYLDPGMVTPADAKDVYAHTMIVDVEPGSLDTIDKNTYASLVKKGTVVKSSYALKNAKMNATGVQYAGAISTKNKDLSGVAVFFTLRDKTIGFYNYNAATRSAFYAALNTARWTE